MFQVSSQAALLFPAFQFKCKLVFLTHRHTPIHIHTHIHPYTYPHAHTHTHSPILIPKHKDTFKWYSIILFETLRRFPIFKDSIANTRFHSSGIQRIVFRRHVILTKQLFSIKIIKCIFQISGDEATPTAQLAVAPRSFTFHRTVLL